MSYPNMSYPNMAASNNANIYEGAHMSDQYMRAMFSAFSTLYTCQNCGGLCQITADLIKPKDQVLTRMTQVSDQDLVSKDCPYCKERTNFQRFMRL